MTQYDSPQEIQRYFQIRMKELKEEQQRQTRHNLWQIQPGNGDDT